MQEQRDSYWADFHEISYLSVSRKSVEKIEVSLKSSGRQWRTLYVKTCWPYFAQFFPERESCKENQNTHFVFNISFLENRAVYEIMWKHIVECGRSRMTIWRMSVACWIAKATNTHSQYVILTAVALQQWLRERASILRLYLHCLPCISQESSHIYGQISEARRIAVGWGTAVQSGRSRVRFSMVSLEFFIAVILPAALCPWGRLSL